MEISTDTNISITRPTWEKFEELVAELQRELAPNATVVRNDHIVGKISRTKRQIDVTVRAKVGNYEVLIILDCKAHKRSVDVKAVESFVGLAEDVGANKAVLVTTKGYSQAAINLATQKGIELYTLIDTKDHEWGTILLSLPAAAEVLSLQGLQIHLSNDGASFLNINISDPRNIEVFDLEQNRIGTIQEILNEQWRNDELKVHVGVNPDVHFLPSPVLVKDAEVEGHFCSVNITATIYVSSQLFFGYIGVQQARGFHSHVTKRTTILKSLTTHPISPNDIKQWQPIVSLSELAVKPIFIMLIKES